MLKTHEYPVMEFDDNRDAKINPTIYAGDIFSTKKLVFTFFPEVMEKLKEEGNIVLERIIGGENPIHMYKFVDADVLILLGTVGCPACCAGKLDLFNAMGINKVMFCGGGGVLDKNIEVGQILVVDGAIRDECFSYHYIEPSRYIYTDKKVTDKIVKNLDEKDISYLRGITWTSEAMFRETEYRIERRKEEGAKIVETHLKSAPN